MRSALRLGTPGTELSCRPDRTPCDAQPARRGDGAAVETDALAAALHTRRLDLGARALQERLATTTEMLQLAETTGDRERYMRGDGRAAG